ncbi:hypothetical protein BJF79_22155 [Actinomadura sp. CNU-125]|uniref:hypothetical protein n=1 Tax=Actinomadura sp. CNU-125 TaxID=1904961 RepID=UPI0009611FBF|nr:hypothetical protein [Actinomadura sp. CNU-125]OLT12538.1 hypothetical protein BJF79_22155 [Actinomadura sp. CNU-125]
MNLDDRQRKIVFGVLAVVLAAVGVYLTVAGPDRVRDEPDDRPTAAATVPTGPASPPPGIRTEVNPEDFDLYRLLPFSRAEFATAAEVAQKFVSAYATYRYDEEPQKYAERLSGLVTDQLGTELVGGHSSAGLVAKREEERTVATGTASLDQVRDIGDNSIIFLVTGTQKVTAGGKETSEDKRWAVTVVRDGGSLKVYAFEPADAGQAGDTG